MSGHLPTPTFPPVELSFPELPDLHEFTLWGWGLLMALSVAQLVLGGVLLGAVLDLARGLLGRLPPPR